MHLGTQTPAGLLKKPYARFAYRSTCADLLPLHTTTTTTLPYIKGLVKYEYSSGDVTLLATHVSTNSALDPGTAITYANDLAIARDGTIYFTSCTGEAVFCMCVCVCSCLCMS